MQFSLNKMSLILIFLGNVFGQSYNIGLHVPNTFDQQFDYGKPVIEPRFNSTCDEESLHAALLCEEKRLYLIEALKPCS